MILNIERYIIHLLSWREIKCDVFLHRRQFSWFWNEIYRNIFLKWLFVYQTLINIHFVNKATGIFQICWHHALD